MTIGAMASNEDIGEQTSRVSADGLVQRARHDAEALGRLYDRHYPGVLRYCVHRLFLREVAEDVTSAVFLQVAGGIRNFVGLTEDDFCNWLYAIAGNQVNAYIRKTVRRKALLEAAVRGRFVVVGSSADTDHLDWSALYQGIAGLSDREQAIVALRIENMPYERIAAVLDIKPTTARVAFNRALKKLRARLAKSMGRA